MSAPHQLVSQAEALHARILDAHAAYRRSERDLALLLAKMASEKLFLVLGYASLRDYGEQVLDLSPRKTRGLAAVGRGLSDLPAVDAAFSSGEIGWTKARELLRVVTTENEASWVERAKQATSRELERMVSVSRPGDEPTDDALKGPSRQRLVLEMDATEAEMIRVALAAMRAATGVSREEVSDGTLLAQMAQRAIHDIEGEAAPTGERYRTVLEYCPRCKHTTAVDSEVSDTHVGLADCDGEVMEMRPGPRRGHVGRTIPPTTRRAVLHRDGYRCKVPGCTNRLWLDVHHTHELSRGGDHREETLISLCSAHHGLGVRVPRWAAEQDDVERGSSLRGHRGTENTMKPEAQGMSDQVSLPALADAAFGRMGPGNAYSRLAAVLAHLHGDLHATPPRDFLEGRLDLVVLHFHDLVHVAH
ncbi:MAG: HNH endonuclease, partial [Deltaproteobacteria bacterium]|nr:HNH endonuclease [Deltaproteobacteria bacterium]